MALPAPMPALSGADNHHRPLPQRTIGTDVSSTGTASVPRVTRIHVISSGASTTGDLDADELHDLMKAVSAEDDSEATIPPDRVAPDLRPRVSTRVDAKDDETQAAGNDPEETQAPSTQGNNVEAPSHRRVPNTAEGEPAQPRARPPRPAALAEVAHDGVLVVDAPADATVTVNGVERGRGTVRVGDLDRDARHAVRIHCPGFAPWSGSVTLQGKPAAKIRPALKPRLR